MTIERLDRLDCDRFLTDFVATNTPCVVTGALSAWKLDEVWTPAHLASRFGRETVQVYDSGFDLVDLMTLDDYFGRYFGKHATGDVPYVRWYTKLREVDFEWADHVFAACRDDWSLPSFIPKTDYILPFSPSPRTIDPLADQFPARGLFISAAGATTRRHVDPWCSDAVLCQLYGHKTWRMYSPGAATTGAAEPTYTFSLGPGEVVFVPHGWPHHVVSDTDSISLTWNFVHRVTRGAFERWLAGDVEETDLEVIRFFFGPVAGPTASIADIHAVIGTLG